MDGERAIPSHPIIKYGGLQAGFEAHPRFMAAEGRDGNSARVAFSVKITIIATLLVLL